MISPIVLRVLSRTSTLDQLRAALDQLAREGHGGAPVVLTVDDVKIPLAADKVYLEDVDGRYAVAIELAELPDWSGSFPSEQSFERCPVCDHRTETTAGQIDPHYSNGGWCAGGGRAA